MQTDQHNRTIFTFGPFRLDAGDLEQLEQSDEQDEVVIDPSAVADALEKLREHPEPEVGFMRTTQGFLPAYNVQAAVDAEHALIVVQQVTDQAGDNGSLQ